MKRILSIDKYFPFWEFLVIWGLLLIGAYLFNYKLLQVSATYDEKTVSLKDARNLVTNLRWDTIESARYPPLLYYMTGWVYRVFPKPEIHQ